MKLHFLFWCLWIINVLLLLLTVAGKEFRSGFGAGININLILITGLIVILVSSMLFRFSSKPKWISLAIVLLPLIILLVWYIYDKFRVSN